MIVVYGIRVIPIVRSPETRSDGAKGYWKNSTIAVRSDRDRGSIGPRSRCDRAAIGSYSGGIASRRSDAGRRATKTTIVARSWPGHGPIAARSWPDHGPIAARLWPDRGPIVPKLVAFSKRNSSSFPADLKPQRHAIETASMTGRDREVVDFTRSRVKNNTELTNLGN